MPFSLTERDAERPVVFLLDCDNTLLDNDALKADMAARLHALLGDALSARFWVEYEDVRAETGLVDLPLTLERFAHATGEAALVARARASIMDYPFASRLYPDTLATLAFLRGVGQPAILSDGDLVYQPRKIERSGLAAAVEGRVLVYAHKEEHLPAVMARWPAAMYVLVDDKGRILAEAKRIYPARFVTVHVAQGHYAREDFSPAADVRLPQIGALRGLKLADLRRFAAPGSPATEHP